MLGVEDSVSSIIHTRTHPEQGFIAGFISCGSVGVALAQRTAHTHAPIAVQYMYKVFVMSAAAAAGNSRCCQAASMHTMDAVS